MDPRISYFSLVLEKLGTPLMAASQDINARAAANGGEGSSPQEEAERIAALLGAVTRAGVTLSDKMDLKADEDTADGLRMSVAALAAPLLAQFFQLSGRLPSDSDIERITSGFETVLAYADNFSAAADIKDRLNGLDNETAPADEALVSLQYFHSLVPVMNAVMAFPFGQPEKKLLGDTTARLLQDARAFREAFIPSANPTIAAKIELSCLKALAQVYTQCHFAEMARLMSMGDKAREQTLSQAPVWTAYESRIDLLGVLAETLAFGGNTSAASGGAAHAPTAQQVPDAPIASQVPPPMAVEPPASEADIPQQNQGSTANPMSFFTKSGDN